MGRSRVVDVYRGSAVSDSARPMQVPDRIKKSYVYSGTGAQGTMVVALTQSVASGQLISHATFCPIPYMTGTTLEKEGRPRPPGADLFLGPGLL